jgi:hypothetical protein
MARIWFRNYILNTTISFCKLSTIRLLLSTFFTIPHNIYNPPQQHVTSFLLSFYIWNLVYFYFFLIFSFPFPSIFHFVCSIFLLCVNFFLFRIFWGGCSFMLLILHTFPLSSFLFVTFLPHVDKLKSERTKYRSACSGTDIRVTGNLFSPKAPKMFHHRIYSRQFCASAKLQLHRGCKILGACANRAAKLAALHKIWLAAFSTLFQFHSELCAVVCRLQRMESSGL